jgi:hypothetical protein
MDLKKKKNTNIQTCKLLVHEAETVWTAAETKTLQSLLHRNESIRGLLASPDLISIGAWPQVFQVFQKTHAATSLIYQGLRGGLTGRLTIPNRSNDDAEQRKSKRQRRT